MLDYIARFYALGLYTPDQVRQFVLAGWITAEQAEEIVAA